jgi:hypothetical protein
MSNVELLLRQIIDISQKPQINIFHGMRELHTAIEEARMFLHQIDRCEFYSENGWRCNEKKVRTVFGICCCEEHAKEREMSFGEY